MDKRQLKNVIKSLVRESITEIFAEINLKSLIAEELQKATQKPRKALSSDSGYSGRLLEADQEGLAPVTSQKLSAEQQRRMLRERMAVAGVDDVYSDILSEVHDNPIVTGENVVVDEAPERALIATGLMKDYSKYI